MLMSSSSQAIDAKNNNILNILFISSFSKDIPAQTDFEKGINKAIKSNENEPAYRRQKAKVLLAQKVLTTGLNEKRLADSALESLRKAEALNPRNLTTLRNSIPLYYFLQTDFYLLTPV